MLFDNIPEVEPDADDLAAIKRIEARGDTGGKTKDEMEHSGKILVRVPKSLHKDLLLQAKSEGVSLNQFIVYKLAGQ